MKNNRFLLAAALGLGVAGISNAGTVYMTGSTAMRSTVYSALIAPGVVFSNAPSYTVFQGGSTGNNAGNGGNYMAFQGQLVGQPVGTTTIQCHWSGSEAGIKDVTSQGIAESFIDPTLIDGADHGTNIPSLTVTAHADLAMADNNQKYAGVYANNLTPPAKLTTGTEVGVITFRWVRNPGLWTGTNVTDSQIKQALGGYCKRAVFTGDATQTNDYVYVSGRDSGSGTRANAFGTSGFGIFTSPNQIEMDSSGVMQDLVGDGTYAGDFGFSSGGTLAGTLGANTTAASDLWNGKTGYSVISYLSWGDSDAAIKKGAVELTYNGVSFSSASVKEGTYTFWGNAYLYQANGAGTEAQAAYGRLSPSTGINNYCDGTKAIKLTDMHCTRTGPTSDPVHK